MYLAVFCLLFVKILANRDEFSCGSMVPVNKKQFIVQSPEYPSHYASSLNCEIILKSRETCETKFHFQLLDLDIQWSQGCVQDRLEIGDKDALCGRPTGIREYLTNDDLRLKFITDEYEEGRGFKILVTRYPCKRENLEPTTYDETYGFTTTEVPILDLPHCCAHRYSDKTFFLSSPGFPNNEVSDCVFEIYRNNSNICRLRLYFEFFWHGDGSAGCNYGFFRIDNKTICGCHNSLTIVSEFDKTWGDDPKSLRYYSIGYPNTAFSGFVIRVIQDECPYRYVPGNQEIATASTSRRHLKRARLLNTKTIRRSKDLYSYYFFRDPEESREDREFADTTTNNYVPIGSDVGKCRVFDRRDYIHLIKQDLYKRMDQCPQRKMIQPPCYEITYTEGVLTTPGYPYYYPRNLNCCYRFVGQQGACEIKLRFLDFDLEASNGCEKDALTVEHTKYCSRSLFETQLNLDISGKQYQDIYFKTDGHKYGRGVKVEFTQVICETIPSTLLPSSPAPTMKPICREMINAENFRLLISRDKSCEYPIYKFEQGVCRLILEFVAFDLVCGEEYLEIDNERICGNRTGEIAHIFLGRADNILIRHQRVLENNSWQSPIEIRGQQITICEPPPQ